MLASEQHSALAGIALHDVGAVRGSLDAWGFSLLPRTLEWSPARASLSLGDDVSPERQPQRPSPGSGPGAGGPGTPPPATGEGSGDHASRAASKLLGLLDRSGVGLLDSPALNDDEGLDTEHFLSPPCLSPLNVSPLRAFPRTDEGPSAAPARPREPYLPRLAAAASLPSHHINVTSDATSNPASSANTPVGNPTALFSSPTAAPTPAPVVSASPFVPSAELRAQQRASRGTADPVRQTLDLEPGSLKALMGDESPEQQVGAPEWRIDVDADSCGA